MTQRKLYLASFPFGSYRRHKRMSYSQARYDNGSVNGKLSRHFAFILKSYVASFLIKNAQGVLAFIISSHRIIHRLLAVPSDSWVLIFRPPFLLDRTAVQRRYHIQDISRQHSSTIWSRTLIQTSQLATTHNALRPTPCANTAESPLGWAPCFQRVHYWLLTITTSNATHSRRSNETTVTCCMSYRILASITPCLLPSCPFLNINHPSLSLVL